MSSFLIADDSHEKILFLRHMLKREKWNADVLVAMTTEEAKTLIDQHSNITAAFIDFYIPSENGPAVITYLKKKIPSAHIALVSSADNPKNNAEAKAAGAEAVVCTTYHEDEVERAVGDLLTQWKAA